MNISDIFFSTTYENCILIYIKIKFKKFFLIPFPKIAISGLHPYVMKPPICVLLE